jgi:hypothetical protein
MKYLRQVTVNSVQECGDEQLRAVADKQQIDRGHHISSLVCIQYLCLYMTTPQNIEVLQKSPEEKRSDIIIVLLFLCPFVSSFNQRDAHVLNVLQVIDHPNMAIWQSRGFNSCSARDARACAVILPHPPSSTTIISLHQRVLIRRPEAVCDESSTWR